MTSRLARFCAALVTSTLASHALAQNPPAPPPAGAAASTTASTIRPAAPENEMIVLNLPDADIDTIITTLESLTGRMVIRPQQLATATYNVRIKKPIPKAEAILYIETVLALNGIAIAPLGDTMIKVVDAGKVKQEAPEMIKGSAFDYPASGKVATKLFQLEFARVQEVFPLFAGMLNPFYGGSVPLPNANAALITDSISNLQRIEALIQQVDRPLTAGMKPKFYSVRNVKASELVNKLRTILSGTLQTQLGSATTYNADDRTQQIVVVTDPRQWDFFTELIDRLDQKSDPNTRTEVLSLNNAKAKDVVDVLTRIISGQNTAVQRQNSGSVRPGATMPAPVGPQPATPGAPAAPPAPAIASASNADGAGVNEFSAFMTVVNDERSNAVVVFGTSDDIRLVTQLVEKLDIVLAQVRIEVVIAEVSLDDNDSSGISALGLRVEGDKLVGFSGTIVGAAGAAGDNAVSITDGALTRTNGNLDLAATISIGSSLRKRNNSIITVPAIVTSHGKKAKIFNGETRPIITGSVVSGSVGGSTSTITQQEIGTTLTATPFIGIDGSVQLELIQDVQDVIGTVLVDGNQQYRIGKRQTESYITVRTGEIIVLGGFRKNADIRERGRLGPIPILGDIFGPRTKTNNRQELVFFLRPSVLTNNSALDSANDLKRIEEWTTRDALKRELDPKYQPPGQPRSLLDSILPK